MLERWLRANSRRRGSSDTARTPITEIPTDWPEDYRRLVQRRIEVIEATQTSA